MPTPHRHVILLTDDEAVALASSFDSAARGRDDFNYLASLDQGDYDPADIERAHAEHAAEVAVEQKVMTHLDEPVLLDDDTLHVLLDALDTQAVALTTGRTRPWERYAGNPATDPKATQSGYLAAAEAARAFIASLLDPKAAQTETAA